MSKTSQAASHADAAVLALHPAPLDIALSAASAGSPTRPARSSRLWLRGGAAAAALLLAGAGTYMLTARKMEITDVVTQGMLVGNGQPQPTQLRYAARGSEIRAIDVRFVRGEGSHTPQSWTVPVDGSTRELGSLNAGTLSPVATAAQRLTFEYTLVDREGRRSAPFEKTFEVVPPARITQLLLPPSLAVGQPLSVMLGYQRGSADVVQVLRRVVESDVPWPAAEQLLPVQLQQAQGQQELRLEVPARAQRSTLEFQLVDSAGVRSAPMRASFSTGAAAPVVAFGTVLSVVPVGGASGLGAVGGAVAGGALANRFGGGTGRAALTALGAIGGALAGHQIEKNVRGSGWETTVQMDGGGVRRIRHGSAPRWQAGTRVRVAGNQIQL